MDMSPFVDDHRAALELADWAMPGRAPALGG
jgi:hypothetical protein